VNLSLGQISFFSKATSSNPHSPGTTSNDVLNLNFKLLMELPNFASIGHSATAIDERKTRKMPNFSDLNNIIRIYLSKIINSSNIDNN